MEVVPVVAAPVSIIVLCGNRVAFPPNEIRRIMNSGMNLTSDIDSII